MTGTPLSVGILETGVPPAALAPLYGSYVSMIQALLGPGYRYRSFDVVAGEFPEAPEACAAYVVTGSSAGVYDDLPWIAPLTTFLRGARGRSKLVGICFGHQIMAQAFGGEVLQSEKGWGLGLHDYRVHEPASWMDDAPSVAVAVSHQDQVVVPPPDARVVGGCAFTPNGILDYADGMAISFQCHPEFEVGFAAALVEARRARLPDPAAADAYLASLDRASDRARVGRWIRRFIDDPAPAGSALGTPGRRPASA